jgi:hypothetical protein
VPAAAVTPAPIAYIKVVAVKKLVVELESFLVGIGLGHCSFGCGGYSKQAKFPILPGALSLV